MEKRVSESSYLSDVETSESFAELDSDTEEQQKELGMIWQGQYFLTLGDPPFVAHRGYTAGNGPLENISNDLILCTKLLRGGMASTCGTLMRNSTSSLITGASTLLAAPGLSRRA